MAIRLSKKEAENLAYALLLEEGGTGMTTVELKRSDTGGFYASIIELDGKKEKRRALWLFGGGERYREIRKREQEEREKVSA